MHITLSPNMYDGKNLTVTKHGDALRVNGVLYDFSQLAEGETLPASAIDSEFVIGLVERIGGVLHLTLMLPHGPDASAAARFPAPIINPPDGALELPQ